MVINETFSVSPPFKSLSWRSCASPLGNHNLVWRAVYRGFVLDSLKIKNWDKWQSYRKDRGQPSWIKLHREVMRNPEWVSLTDSQRGQLVAIWLLAADHNGTIPASPVVIKKLCHLDSDPELKLFINLGFIIDDNQVVTKWLPDGAEVVRQEKSREEESREDNVPTVHVGTSSRPVNNVPFSEILNLYHTTLPELPKVAKLTAKRQGYIRQRWAEDLPTLDDWKEYFQIVRKSDFLMGRAQPTNGRAPFRADIEWLANASNIVKVIEGKYHGHN